MANLNRIDLTQGRRFEKSLYKPSNIGHGNSTHRLKKGEIPHKLNNYNAYTTTSTISTNSFDVVSDWALNINTVSLGNITYTLDEPVILDDIIVNNSFIAPSNNTSLITWSMDRGDNISEWVYTTTSDTYYSNSIKIYNSNIEDTLYHRFKKDPFEDSYDYNRSNILYKIKESKNDDRMSFILNHNKGSIIKRLSGKSGYDGMYDGIRFWDSDDYDDARYRLGIPRPSINLTTSQNANGLGPQRTKSMRDIEQNLKEKAPFIKRVYLTNRGRTFDSTEFRFDMVLAEEHFSNALKNIRI